MLVVFAKQYLTVTNTLLRRLVVLYVPIYHKNIPRKLKMPTPKSLKILLYISTLFAVPFFLMVYCLRCERLRLGAQKRMIDRLIEVQRQERHEKETRYRDCVDKTFDDDLPERY